VRNRTEATLAVLSLSWR